MLSRRSGPRFADVASPQGLGSWSADSLTDSVRLSFSDGFSGAVVTVAASTQRTDTLRGRIAQHWDSGPPFTTDERGAILVRFACRRGGGAPLTADGDRWARQGSAVGGPAFMVH
jgi:hypothetical protein